jgi:hypothetical protein
LPPLFREPRQKCDFRPLIAPVNRSAPITSNAAIGSFQTFTRHEASKDVIG